MPIFLAGSGIVSLTSIRSITTVLVSRFLLDLQSANHTCAGGGTHPRDMTSDTSRDGGATLIFERMIGSIGSSIVSGEGEFEHAFNDDVEYE